jgi:hypothetical protein
MLKKPFSPFLDGAKHYRVLALLWPAVLYAARALSLPSRVLFVALVTVTPGC